MAKNLKVNLQFTADTGQARAQLQQLTAQLNTLTSTTASNLKITPEIQKAQQAAIQLKTALAQAVNVDTGKFDLVKFSSSLTKMGTNLSALKTQLVSLGPSGQQAFMSLAQSIMQAEIPMQRLSKHLTSLKNTIANTLRWQISSSLLHGVAGEISTAFRYAQDLNESLNNIRIVTGQNVDEMAKFAREANKAAKALSTTTTKYTDASLIYYQQGLSDEEVKKRTDITIKMANVAGESVETVSDQLTAVWNNFDNGTKSLEYYADVMTALGAATASSVDEITGGLEKFAAIGDTIGLSFEYAASALATITSNTRQSEEVVGTALKTIFARIQGLKLGETQDDGTDLNKYSEALAKVGISIFDSNGELKVMDNILNEMAAKWDSLNNAQQTALAQTVAGVRQYTQLIALMENWNNGDNDSMMANLNTSYGSTGTLQEQADIYAESWEAAQDRVKAAAEDIYSTLLNDEFFIDVYDTFAKFLSLVDSFLESMGGAKGLLTGLSSILLTVFGNEVAKGLENIVYNFKTFVGLTKQQTITMQQEAFKLSMESFTSGAFSQTVENKAIVAGMQSQLELSHALALNQENMTETEALQAKYIIEQNKAYADQVALLGQKADTSKQNLINSTQDLRNSMSMYWTYSTIDAKQANFQKTFDLSETITQELIEADQAFLSAPKTGLEQYKTNLQNLVKSAEKAGLSTMAQGIRNRYQMVDGTERTEGGILTYVSSIQKKTQDDMQYKADIDLIAKGKKLFGEGKTDVTEKQVKEHLQLTRQNKEATDEYALANKNLSEQTQKAKEQISKFGTAAKTLSQNIVGVAQSAMSLSFAISSFKSVIATWKDESLSAGEKVLQTFMSLGMAIPMVMNGIKGLNSTFKILNTIQATQALIAQKNIDLLNKNIITMEAKELAEKAHISLAQAQLAIGNAKSIQQLKDLTLSEAKIATLTKEQLIKETGLTIDQADLVLSRLKEKATLEEIVAELSLTGAKNAGTIATKLATKANLAFLATMPPMLVMAALIVAIVAVIAGLVAGVKALTDAWNKDANAVKEAKQAVDEAKTSFDEAKTSLDNLKTSLSEYESFQNTFNDLTEGTKEWNQALAESNAHVLEMLRQYPELANQFKKDSNGKFYFENPEVIQDLYENRVITAESNLNTSQIALNSAENRSLRTDALRNKDIADTYNANEFITLVAGSVSAGVIAGSMSAIPVLGPITGALMGLSAGLINAIETNRIYSKESEQALDKLQKAYNESGSLVFSSYEEFSGVLEGISAETIEALWNNKDALENLTEETKLNTIQMRALIEANAASANATNIEYNALSETEKALADVIIANRATDALSDPDSEAYKTALKQAKDIFTGVDNYDAYLEARFGADKDNYRVVNTGGNNATLQKRNEEGGWDNIGEKNSLTKQEVLDFMTSHYLQQFNSELDNPLLDQMSSLSSDLSAIGFGSSKDQDRILELQKDLINGEGISLLNFNPEEFNKIKPVLEENAKKLGGEYHNAIVAALNDYNEDEYYKNAVKNKITEIDNIFNSGAEELDITKEALESYAGSLMQANGEIKDLTNATNEERLAYLELTEAYAQAAVANYRLAIGINKVQKAFSDHIDVLTEGNEASLDFHEAIGELTIAMKEAFGMKVDAKFVKDNLQLIKEMSEGSEQALVDLRNKLNEDFILKLKFEDNTLNQELLTTLEQLQQQALNNPVGTILQLDNDKAIAALNEALITGQATIEDIQAMFNNANLQMPEYKTKSIPGDAVHSHSVVSGKVLGIPYTLETDTTTTTDRVVPYFGDNAPEVDHEGNITSYGGGGSLAVTTSGPASMSDLNEIIEYNDEDNADAIKDKNFENLQKSLELNLYIDESDLEHLEYLLDKYEDDFYKLNESVETLFKTIEPRENILETHENYISQLNASYEAGQISQEDYISGLENSKDAIYDQLNALLDLDKQMREYYGNTLDEADDELGKHTDHLANLTKVFDHYINLLDIFGKSKDYDTMGDFLEGQAHGLKNELDVAEAYYDGLVKEKEEVKKLFDEAVASGNEEDIKYYGKMYDDITDSVDRAYEDMLEKTEAWAESMKKIYENTFNKLSDELEKALTDGMGFDSMLNDFDLLNQQQEEFLTKTNQIYETNKLMRTATKAMDDTSNKAAKQKIKNYIEETKKLQNTTRLSKYELEIQQAKYDLLLAEIALEEAQNAKSTVRLTRDNEGNFGYVYTADQDEVDDAQQKLEDAQNNLYNIQYEGQQNALTKYVEALQDYYNAQTELQEQRADGTIASDEELKEKQALLEDRYFGPTGILTELSRLYNITLQENTNATAENLLNQYGFMTDGVEQHANLVQQYIGEMDVAWADFQRALTLVHDDVQTALGDSEQATEDLKNESDELAKEIKDVVIPAIHDEIGKVREQVAAYGDQRNAILDLISRYEDYIKELDKVIAKELELAAAQGNGDGSQITETPGNLGNIDLEDTTSSSSSSPQEGDMIWTGRSENDTSGRYMGYLDGKWVILKEISKERGLYSANGITYVFEEGKLIKRNYKPSSTGGPGSNVMFDTGGYTGDWGPEGKLAMLHEKELVLNAADTSNILSAVSIIREIARDIDARASMSNLSLLTSAIGVHDTNQVLEQMVSIEASFPNATDRYEIEEAFNSLVNKAAQYANRK